MANPELLEEQREETRLIIEELLQHKLILNAEKMSKIAFAKNSGIRKYNAK
ncbi:hypothetical protein ONQ60_28275 [Salmonella enterica subsp. enterica serovar Virginia]|nr:hypothetical protein [Salmonella enterica subsp. enterica serovar Virginia]